MFDKTVVDWTYKLQYTLDQMNDIELTEFEKKNVIRYEGKIWGKNEQGKNSKTNRKTSRAVKDSGLESKNIREN